MTIEEVLLRFISSEILPNDPVDLETGLVSSGLLDSLGLIRIFGFIELEYGVSLLKSVGPEEFGSIKSLAAAVRTEMQSGTHVDVEHEDLVDSHF